MKTTTNLLLIVLMAFMSCKKNEQDITTSTPYTYKGTFKASAHPTSGIALISEDKTKLIFESFKSDSGPDLNIYLASDINNIKADFIDLGDIKGLNGNYTYAVNSSLDFAKYKYVVVWCVDFNVNFGYALLAP